MITTNELRKKYLDFFKSKSHTIVTSDSLVPKDDPTVLFTTAGMQQFKRQFLGHIEDFTKASTSQKCLRTDDLDEVGKTAFHHTFFEMLGNFSFGDYFKKEAISWAWEFLTQILQIPAEKLWVSVYQDDEEAYHIWVNDIHFPADRIVKLGDKSNFWPSDCKAKGPNGPCGPCSEIFFDYGIGPNGEGEGLNPGNDNIGRFSEIWNLVFTQYNRKEGGELEPLPSQNIDTGMGLERLAAVLQNKTSNFEIDLFEPILKSIDAEMTINVSSERNERYVIADHCRAITFGIADGVVPSNEGRGYIMKKLIIDSTDIAISNGQKKASIFKIIPSVISTMSEQYPELIDKSKEIQAIVKNIEEAYIKVRKVRLPEFINEVTLNQENAAVIGEIYFKYRDTFGLTVPTMQTALQQLKINKSILTEAEKIFAQLMKKQQEQSRASSKMIGDVFTGMDLKLDVDKTVFLGYEHAEANAQLLALINDNKIVDQVNASDQVKIILNQTPFYAESGGQVGDTGFMSNSNGIIRIDNVFKQDDIFIHCGEVLKGSFQKDDQVDTIIDVDRRLSIMRNHTATHLLQFALRKILGSHIKQQGSFVAADRLRFDFTHPSSIANDQLREIEDLINVLVRSCDPVRTEFLPIDEAKKLGALAFFAEKYGKEVHVVTIGDYSKEFCGGTHLGSTGQIGLFKIVNESAIAQGIRRIEAKTGIGALEDMKEQEQQLNKAAAILKTPVQDLIDRVQQQSNQLKQLKKDNEQLKFETIKSTIVTELTDAQEINGIRVFSKLFQNIEIDLLRKMSDFIAQKLTHSVIILGSTLDNNAAVLIACSDEAVKKGYKANELIKEIADKIDGRGGGRPQLAQAGGKNTQNIDQTIQNLRLQIINKEN